jgi:HEAT repeat protein
MFPYLDHHGFRRAAAVAVIGFVLCSTPEICLAQSSAETKLIKVLTDSTSGKPEKALACKKLAVVGSAQCVDELAALLKDPELNSWARIALEAIEADQSEAALLNAAKDLQGLPLIGVVNSLGVKRSEAAVKTLAGLLDSDDLQVVSAAAMSLGKTGGQNATTELQARLQDAEPQRRSAISEALVRCAEQLHQTGQSAAAASLYDSLLAIDLPLQRKIEATRGAILSQGVDGVSLLLATMQEENPRLRRIALKAVRQLQGDGAIEALTKAMAQVPQAQQPLYLNALGDRQQKQLVPTLTQIVETYGDQGDALATKLEAIKILSKLGGVDCLETLVSAATSKTSAVANQAMETLASVDDKNLNQAITDRVTKATGAEQRVMLGLIGSRRIPAVKPLLTAVNSSDPETRVAALKAMGSVATLEEIPTLIDRATRGDASEESKVALSALRSACVRMPDQAACAKLLSNAIRRAELPVQQVLLKTLAGMGGPESLQVIGDVANSSNKNLQDAATRLLGGWMSVDAGDVLMNIAKQPRHPYRIRALRAYMRLVRQFLMDQDQRHRMVNAALKVATRDAEKTLILDAAQRYPSETMLAIAVDLSKQPGLKAEAQKTALKIAGKIKPFPGLEAQIRKLKLPPIDLKIEEAVYGAKQKEKDVTSVLQKNVLPGSPVILLGTPSYNTAFGGDVAPGMRKQLRVKYSINGKPNEAVFKENDGIVLPMP